MFECCSDPFGAATLSLSSRWPEFPSSAASDLALSWNSLWNLLGQPISCQIPGTSFYPLLPPVSHLSSSWFSLLTCQQKRLCFPHTKRFQTAKAGNGGEQSNPRIPKHNQEIEDPSGQSNQGCGKASLCPQSSSSGHSWDIPASSGSVTVVHSLPFLWTVHLLLMPSG